MSTVHHRYHICDPELQELAGTEMRRVDALRMAAFLAGERGYPLEVYDSMARRGRPELWRVDGADHRTVVVTRGAKHEE